MSSDDRLPTVILAGGLARRMRPVTDVIPKALVEVAGCPFLSHQLALLRANGVRRVLLLVGHLGEQIQARYGDGSACGVQLEYAFDGPVLLGTGGAVRRVLDRLPPAFFLMYGDSYLTCDFAAVQAAFAASGCRGLMTVFRNDNLFDTSNVEFDGARILRYDKRQRTAAMTHIDYGLSVFDRRAFASLPDGEPMDLSFVCESLLHQHSLAAYEVPSRFYEIGSPEGLRDTDAFLRSTAHGCPDQR